MRSRKVVPLYVTRNNQLASARAVFSMLLALGVMKVALISFNDMAWWQMVLVFGDAAALALMTWRSEAEGDDRQQEPVTYLLRFGAHAIGASLSTLFVDLVMWKSPFHCLGLVFGVELLPFA